MHRQSSSRYRLAVALAVLCATSGSARFAVAQVEPPDWEPGCSPVPLPCVQGSGAIKLDFTRHTLVWKWTGGGLVGIPDVSNPTISDRYDFCVYDGSNAPVLAIGVPSAGICSGRPCWKARSWGFLYRDPGGAVGGFTTIRLKAASRRHDRFLVQAAGAALPMPSAAPAPPLVVQLVRTHEHTLLPEACWTTTQPTS
jgi:hypothetical protein